MINCIWLLIFSFSLLFSLFNGSFDKVTAGIFEASSKAVELTLTLSAVICFWSGIMEIAQQSGFTEIIARILHPLTKFFFPTLGKQSKALKYIVMNMTANLLGLGNAATPFGILAVKELDRENGYSEYASNAMCMFVIINTASLQLLPTTIIALRSAAGSSAPAEITVPIWLTSISALSVGALLARLLERQRTYA